MLPPHPDTPTISSLEAASMPGILQRALMMQEPRVERKYTYSLTHTPHLSSVWSSSLLQLKVVGKKEKKRKGVPLLNQLCCCQQKSLRNHRNLCCSQYTGLCSPPHLQTGFSSNVRSFMFFTTGVKSSPTSSFITTEMNPERYCFYKEIQLKIICF